MFTSLSFKLNLLIFVGLLVFAWAGMGCDEARFDVPKSRRADANKYKTRMLAAPLASYAKKQATTRPKNIPSSLHFTTNYGHPGNLLTFALSPSGLFGLSGGSHQRVIRWKLPKGKQVQTWVGIQGKIRKIDISASGRRVVLLEGTNGISIWSVNGKLYKRIHTKQPLTQLRFAPISNLVLALTQKGSLLHFHGSTLQLKRQQQICPEQKSALSFDIDALQQWMGVGCQTGHLWLGRFGQKGKLKQMGSPITAIALSPKKPVIAIGMRDARFELWRVKPSTGSLTKKSSYLGHIRAITQIKFSPNGKNIASGSLDRYVGLWKLKKQKLSLVRRLRHTAAITSLTWLPEQQNLLLTTDLEGHIRIWRTSGSRLLVRSPTPLKGGLVSFSKKRPWLITHGEKGFSVWDLKTGQRKLASRAHPHSLIALDSAADGNHLLAVDRDNVVFWDLHRRRYIDIVYPPKGARITAATLGRSWTEVWFGTLRDGVFLWTIAGKRMLYRHTTPRYVSAVAYHPKTQRAVAATLHGKLYLYDMQRKRLLQTQSLPSVPISKVAFSPSGKQLVIIQGNRATLRAWAQDKDIKVLRHTTKISSVKWTPDGKKVLLGGQDHRLSWWNILKKVPEQTLKVCLSPIKDIDVLKRLPYIAVACQDGAVHLIHKQKKTKISTHIPLTEKEWLSYTPSLDFVASTDAFRHFFFSTQNKRLSLHSFQDWFFSPKRVQKSLVKIR